MAILFLSTVGCLLMFSEVTAEYCPDGTDCRSLQCCVKSTASTDYFCCNFPVPNRGIDNSNGLVWIAPGGWWSNHWGITIGLLIAGILISIILSLLCCFFCNGCWLYRWRRGDSYVTTGSDFPLAATVYFHPFPPAPAYSSASTRPYSDSSLSDSEYSSKTKVRFDDDPVSPPPKSILKRAA